MWSRIAFAVWLCLSAWVSEHDTMAWTRSKSVRDGIIHQTGYTSVCDKSAADGELHSSGLVTGQCPYKVVSALWENLHQNFPKYERSCGICYVENIFSAKFKIGVLINFAVDGAGECEPLLSAYDSPRENKTVVDVPNFP